MGVNSLPKTVTRQRRGCDLNPGPSAPESSMLTSRLQVRVEQFIITYFKFLHRSTYHNLLKSVTHTTF